MNSFRKHFLNGSGNLREALLHFKFIRRIAVLHEELPKASRRHKMKHRHVQRLHAKVQAAPEGQKHSLTIHLDRAQLECASLLCQQDRLASEFEAHSSVVLQGSLYQRALGFASPFIYKASKAVANFAGIVAVASVIATVPTGLFGRFMDDIAARTALGWEIGAFIGFAGICVAASAAEKFFKTVHKLQKHEKKIAALQPPAEQAKAV